MKNPMAQIKFPIKEVDENIIYNINNEVWAVYRLDFDYLPINNDDAYLQYVRKTIQFLKLNNYRYRFNLIPRNFDFDKHMQKTIDSYVKGELEEEGNYYLKRAKDILQEEAFGFEYDVVLQVQLNVSDKVTPDNAKDFIKKLQERVSEDISRFIFRNENTENSLTKNTDEAERKFLLTASSYKAFEKATPSLLNKYLYYMFHRNESIVNNTKSDYEITEGIIENHKGYMTIEHADRTDYITFLPFSQLPARTYGFKFIDMLKTSFDFPMDITLDFRFKDKNKNLKEVRKFKKRLGFFNQNIINDPQLDEDEVVQNAPERLENLIDGIKEETTDLLYLDMMLCVYAESKEEMEHRVQIVMDSISKNHFKLERPTVDQLVLFHKSILGSDTEYNYFEQVADPKLLAQSGIDLTHKVGNNYGFPIGQNVTGCGVSDIKQARFKNNGHVFMNPLLTKYDIKGAKHTNGNMLISGPPGSGKSLGVKNMFTWSSFFGAKSLYVDPKNEYRRNIENAVEKYPNNEALKGLYEKMNFVHLSSDELYRGALDPLIFLEGEIALATAKRTLMLLGNVNDERSEVNIVTECIKKEMAQSKFPTLTGAVERIRAEGENNDEATSIATFIENFNTGLGKMLFGNKDSQPLTFTNQITVLGVQGLTLPNKVEGGARANTSLEDDERIGLAIMTAITKYVHIFSRNYEEDALMIMDEAWIFNSSQEGETLINEMLRTGRSLKTDIWLVTQAFDDYNTPTFRELIGCKMAYRPKSDANTDELLDFFGLQINEDNRQVIANLATGICLYEDYRGRVEVIANDIMFEEWFEAFKTTDKDNVMLKAEEEHYA